MKFVVSPIRRSTAAICAAAFLFAMWGTAFAQMGGGGARPAPQFPDIDEEAMILDVPDKWYPYSRRTDAKIDTYIFPIGDEPADWDETLRQEIFHTTAGVTTPRQVFELRSDSNRNNCVELETEVLQESEENGYPMFLWKQVCEMPEQVVASVNKVVLGREHLYTLSKVWKYEPRNREWTRWEDYFQRVYVCDPVIPEHRCRPIRPTGGQGGRGR
jgi:hypothetical protein